MRRTVAIGLVMVPLAGSRTGGLIGAGGGAAIAGANPLVGAAIGGGAGALGGALTSGSGINLGRPLWR